MNTESKYSIEDIVNKTILKTLHSINFEIHPKEWMTLKELLHIQVFLITLSSNLEQWD